MDDLARLRAELDGLDDAVHDLLIRRAAIVTRVAASKPPGGGRLRPGREAAILRRLLARHHGTLPPVAILRIWRELLAGSVTLQGPFSVAVATPALATPALATPILATVAREHFGALTPITLHDEAGALAAVVAGDAAVAVMPDPGAWWSALLASDLHIVARLPFWRPRPPGAPTAGAYVVAAHPPDPSGDDRSLVAVHGPAADLTAIPAGGGTIAEGGGWTILDLPGFRAADDPDLRRLPCPVRLIGAYAVPIA